jgi:hypothetical protein
MRRGLIVAAALAVVGAGGDSANALAAATTLTVTSPSDEAAGDPSSPDLTCNTALASPAMGACTLRAAIDTINAQAPGSGPYTIVVPTGHYLLTERYEISKDVTITGAGANTSIIDGQNAHNPFFISSTGLNVTISGVEITGGNSFPRGGGIYNYGNLELANDWITGNTASDQGGGVYNNGGNLTIVSSTISANNAGNGAGINSGQLSGPALGTLSVVNSTISGNVAVTDGGGIRSLYDTGTTLLNDTIAANTAGTAGGGLNTESPSGPITLKNTILAGNTAGSAPSDCAVAGGPIASTGHNIDQSGTCHLGGPGDMSLNPLLGPLAYYGGHTETSTRRRSPSLPPGLLGEPVVEQGACEANVPSYSMARQAASPHGLIDQARLYVEIPSGLLRAQESILSRRSTGRPIFYFREGPEPPAPELGRVNHNRRGAVRLGRRDQVVLHDEAEALRVAIDGRNLRIGRCALKARDKGLRSLHRRGDHGLRALLLLTLPGQSTQQLTPPASGVQQPRELGVARGALVDHLV